MGFDKTTALSRGQEVIRLEAAALKELSSRLDARFLEASNAILNCNGRVVVTGMGKAGLVGQKISATLASTGTPSLFLHPAEALHGDLGRIRPKDLIIALSKSGKTRELLHLVMTGKAMGAKIIVITASASSPLAQESDICVELGSAPEACPLGLAPTVSTTQMLALGDALAMAVLESRDFTREEFARFHPAGSLGQELMQVEEIMRKGEELPLIHFQSQLGDALKIMGKTPGKPGAALIVDADGVLLGIFTDGDLRRLASKGTAPINEPIELHMKAEPRTLSPAALVGEALHLFRKFHVDQMPVVDEKHHVLGLVDVQDLLEVRL